MNKKMKKIVIYVVAVLTMLLYFNNINNIIESTFSETKIEIDSLDGYLDFNRVYYDENPINFNTITGQIGYYSWAFVPTDDENLNREATLLFVSEENVYSLDLYANSNRVDVYGSFYKELSLIDNRLGVTQVSSVVNLPDGLYRIYMHVKENENSKGIAITNAIYQKEGINFEKIEFVSEKNDKINAVEGLEIVENVFSLESDSKSEININGWMCIQGMNSFFQKVSANLVSKTTGESYNYSTKQVQRTDVAQSYDDVFYLYSGIEVAIPTEDIPNGTYELVLAVENDGKEGKSNTYELIKTDENITMNMLTQEDLFESNLQNDVKDYAELVVVPNNVQASIDDKYIDISGWIFLEDTDSQSQVVITDLISESGIHYNYDTIQVSRNDVATKFDEELYGYSGFRAKILAADVPDGCYRLTVVVENKDNEGKSNTYELIKSGTDITMNILIEEEYFESNLQENVEDYTNLVVVPEDIQVSVNGNCIDISGWIVLEEMDSQSQVVITDLVSESGKHYTYDTIQVERRDVAENFSEELYSYSGFKSKIPIDDVPDGTYEMKVVVENDEKKGKSNIYELIKVGTDITVNILIEEEYFESNSQENVEDYKNLVVVPENFQVTANGDYIDISGWIVLEEMDSQSQVVITDLVSENGKHYTYDTIQVERRDVAEYFSEDLYSYSGFKSKIRMDRIPDGTYELVIVVKNNGEKGKSNEYELKKDGTDIIVNIQE